MAFNKEKYQNIIVFDLNNTNDLLIVLRTVWFKEFQSFYLKLIFGVDSIKSNDEKEKTVNKILDEELELISRDIETGDSQKWIEWLAWFNTKQMLSQNIEPLLLPRISE